MKLVGALCCSFITAMSGAMNDDHCMANAFAVEAPQQQALTGVPVEQLYAPGPWTTVLTLTPEDILITLRIINKELAETQAKLDALSDQIPQDKKVAIDALLAKWCTDAQVHMEQVQYESKLQGAKAFMKEYRQQEKIFATHIAEIERLIHSAQAPENELDGLMGALSLGGQVRNNVLIGDLEALSLGKNE